MSEQESEKTVFRLEIARFKPKKLRALMVTIAKLNWAATSGIRRL
jgi:hypothetical protein